MRSWTTGNAAGGLLLLSLAAYAGDRTVAREFYAEPPTLISPGFEWKIDGDDNHNASVSVSYRKKGETDWKTGVPLPNINDGFTGRAPDLGAYEVGQPEPHYGPRP